jgi:hypothetical protein
MRRQPRRIAGLQEALDRKRPASGEQEHHLAAGRRTGSPHRADHRRDGRLELLDQRLAVGTLREAEPGMGHPAAEQVGGVGRAGEQALGIAILGGQIAQVLTAQKAPQLGAAFQAVRRARCFLVEHPAQLRRRIGPAGETLQARSVELDDGHRISGSEA